MEVRRGLTMIEMLVVVAVIVAVSALALPAIESRMAPAQLDAAVSQIQAAVISARAEARERALPVSIVWSAQAHAGVLTFQDGSSADKSDQKRSSGKAGDGRDRALSPRTFGDPLTGVVAHDVPAEGARTGDVPTGQRLVLAMCLPDGRVESPMPVVISAGGNQLELQLNHWTGAVTTRAYSDGAEAASGAQESPPTTAHDKGAS